MGLFSSEKIFGIKIRESLDNGSDFSNPDIDYRMLFLGEDGALHLKDSAGAVTNVDAGGGGYTEGTVFPGTPASGAKFFHNTYDLLFFYDGTRWLSATQYTDVIPTVVTVPISASLTTGRMALPHAGTTAIYAESLWLSFHVASGGSALSASHKWDTGAVTAPTGTSLGNITIDSGSSNVWRTASVAVNAAIATTEFAATFSATKTGTPGNLIPLPRLVYRIIGT